MINETPKKLITFNSRNIEMMNAISAEIGLETAGEICRRGIEELYNKYFKPYSTGSKAVLTPEAQFQSAQIKAKAKHIEKKTQEELKYEKKIKMCQRSLGGEVEENPDGSRVCVFTQYTLSGDNKLTIPLAQVDPIVAETSLFMPSKASIFKNRPEIEKLFNKLNKE